MNHLFINDCEKFLSLIVDLEKNLHDETAFSSLNDILDQLEIILDQFLPFNYSQIFLLNDNKELELLSSFIPEGINADKKYLNWVIENKEITILEEESNTSNSEKVLYLPLLGSKEAIGIVVLWINFESAEFTQGISALLMLLSQIIATRIEAFKLNKKLNVSQSQLTDIVESVGHGILAIDENNKIILINGTLELIFNLNRKNILGKKYHDVLPENFSHIITTVITSNSPEESELSLAIPDSSIILGITTSILNFGNNLNSHGHVILCRDLSMTLELSKMREVDTIKNDFLSLVSHELRTPLTSILAYTEALQMEGMVESKKDRQEYLEIIHKEGERLTRLINDVLDLTKMESGKIEYHYMNYSLSNIIKSAIASSTMLAYNSKIEFTFEEKDMLPDIYCDMDRIMQVLLNLISNAIKFTPEGGKVAISLEKKSENTEDFAYISVTDTGIGIAPEDLNKVFSRFEQIESLSHHSQGTGLGMPICKKIIENGHKGKIGLSSKIGIGSKFFFTLPIDTNRE